MALTDPTYDPWENPLIKLAKNIVAFWIIASFSMGLIMMGGMIMAATFR
jgi:hypothetical protein